jgi:hypothetical protein
LFDADKKRIDPYLSGFAGEKDLGIRRVSVPQPFRACGNACILLGLCGQIAKEFTADIDPLSRGIPKVIRRHQDVYFDESEIVHFQPRRFDRGNFQPRPVPGQGCSTLST